VRENEIAIGIDGCAAPNFAIPIAAMARSFATLVNPAQLHSAIEAAANRIVKAMVEHPDLVGGTGRLDTMLMQAAEGRIVSKVGADGVWLCGVIPCERYPTGLGIALKVADGDDHRGRPVIAVEVLKQLGLLAADDLPELSPMPIKTRRDDVVGSVQPIFQLALRY
jgi:L-asparaginase II